MKQTIVIETENDVDLKEALDKYSHTVDSFNEMSRLTWELVLKSFGTEDKVSVISVTTAQ